MKDLRKELLDELLEDYEKPEDLLGEEGLLKSLQKALMERAFGAELTEHLGYEKGDPGGRGSGNSRNGHGSKRVLTESSVVEVSVPRDRNGCFEPQLVRKGQSRLPGFDEKVISLYARGMTQREIKGHLEEFYAISVSPDLISRVTDAVIEEVKAWQTRPLDPIYPVIFFDALRVKIRDEGRVRNKAVYLAIGIRMDGTKEILGLWIEQSEGAKFWLRVMNELKARGIKDCLIAVVDGLKGFPEAINAVFPETQVQTCIVHLMRYGLSLCAYKDRRQVGQGHEGDLSGRDRRGRGRSPGRVRAALGRQVSLDRRRLAPALAGGHPDVRLCSGDPASDLHHQCHRKPASQLAKVHQDQRPLPQ